MDDLEKKTGESRPARREGSPQSGAASGDKLVFHYSREHRLSRASPEVRRVYEEGYNLNKGFIKGLTGNAGLRSTFIMIIILCAAIGLISTFGPSSDTGSISGVEVALSAFTFGENLFVSLSFEEAENPSSPLPGMIMAELTVLDSEDAVLTAGTVTGWYSGEELALRRSFPDYGGKTVLASIFVIPESELDLPADFAPEEEAALSLSAKIRKE